MTVLPEEIIWRLGDDVLAGQHDVQLLPNGNILLFDNGPYRKYDMWTYSRVLEINPKTNEIVWQYMDSPVFSFYSQHISGAQRLANGNTMICEGATGRIFQVTPDNKTVWEYIIPHFEENNGGVPVNVVFRAYHYTEDQIPYL